MSAIKSENTRPEMLVRSLLHRLGFRFRIHVGSLPGRPDIVLPKYLTVIFVNGCFWHQHAKCKNGRTPSSNLEYWEPKLRKNIERDRKNYKSLRKLGWKVLVVWECKLKCCAEKEVSRLASQIVKAHTEKIKRLN